MEVNAQIHALAALYIYLWSILMLLLLTHDVQGCDIIECQ
jgi:hypothetical protein